MAIKLLSSEVEYFDPQPAIDLYVLKPIRPNFKEKAPHFTAFKYTVEGNEEQPGTSAEVPCAGAGETAQVPTAAAAESDDHPHLEFDCESERESVSESDYDTDSLLEEEEEEKEEDSL